MRGNDVESHEKRSLGARQVYAVDLSRILVSDEKRSERRAGEYKIHYSCRLWRENAVTNGASCKVHLYYCQSYQERGLRPP